MSLRPAKPKLAQTLDRYLQSLEPFLLEQEAHGGPSFAEAMRTRVKMADKFERGLGSELQERLIGWSVGSSTSQFSSEVQFLTLFS